MTWKDELRKTIDEDPEDMTSFMNISPRMEEAAEKRKGSKSTPTVYGKSSKEGAKLYQDLVQSGAQDIKLIKSVLDNYLESLILAEVLTVKRLDQLLNELEDKEEKITDFMKESGGGMAQQLEVMDGRFKFNHTQRSD